VAIVRNGVCTECHLKVAIGALASLAHETDIQLCGNCGRYLFLPAQEPVLAAALHPLARTARRKKETFAQAHAG
jgi:NMD protein affecting ribosome stability and mRNA decay